MQSWSGLVVHRRASRILLHRLDPVLRGRLGVVGLARSDGLAVEHAPTATSRTSNSGEYGNIELAFMAALKITSGKVKVGNDSDRIHWSTRDGRGGQRHKPQAARHGVGTPNQDPSKVSARQQALRRERSDREDSRARLWARDDDSALNVASDVGRVIRVHILCPNLVAPGVLSDLGATMVRPTGGQSRPYAERAAVSRQKESLTT